MTLDEKMNYINYDRVIVAFSGGKDSLACLLHLLNTGCPVGKIELWHHDIDGREGSKLMDWPVTRSYCQAVADHFDLPIYFSWKVGGFEREMLREKSLTAPTKFETPNGVKQVGGTRGKESTRRKFPQVSANLNVRWCSAYLKIDVASTALRNQERFNNIKTLFVTGERAQESAARSKYAKFEIHRADNRDGKSKRHIDHWRPVLHWSEGEVWYAIEQKRINPHPAYKLGWGRVSCAGCIFGSANQFASLRKINRAQFDRLSAYEAEFGLTIKREKGLDDLANSGNPYNMQSKDVVSALAEEYHSDILANNWELPAGAFGESCGPV